MNGPETLIGARRAEADHRIELLSNLLMSLGTGGLLADSTCLYVTGSLGRGEASRYSDLDSFLVTRDETTFGRLQEIEVFSDLIRASRELGFPDFTDDGEYLYSHSVGSFLKELGKPTDDFTNVFTARMLLLLESKPVVGADAYNQIILQVIEKYWRDFSDHRDDFLPVFLTNDIVRYWKVLCLSYEAHGEEEQGKRRLRNYKLKHSRLMTCYSAVLYFCWLLRRKSSLTPDDAFEMIKLRPLERLENIAGDDEYRELLTEIFSMYEMFLRNTDGSKSELIARFGGEEYDKLQHEARHFGDKIFQLLRTLSAENARLFRYLAV